jgi:hypothetical protein
MPQTVIPIWPGTSTFTSGSTPFGFYDADTLFASDADKSAKWCAQRLGYPIVNIELQAINFYTAFEEAVTEYSNQVNQFNIRDNMMNLQGSSTSNNMSQQLVSVNLDRIISLSSEYGVESGFGGKVTYKSASLQLQTGVQDYDLSSSLDLEGADIWSDIEIKRILHYAPPAISRYFDPFVGTGMGSQQMLEQFGWGSYSPGVSFMMMPIYADLLRLQAIEFNDQIRRSGYAFELHNNRLKIFPIPTADITLWMEYIVKADRANPFQSSGSALVSDFSNASFDFIPYSNINDTGRRWIWQYMLAVAKEMLGQIRTKYATVPFPNGELTLNGGELLGQAAAEKEALVTQLRENLTATSRDAQLTKKQSEAEALQQQLNKIPIGIWIA